MVSKEIVKQEQAIELLNSYAQAVPEASSSEDWEDRVAAQILSAESLDDALMESKANSLQELDGKPLVVHGILRVNGGLNARLGWYLLVDVERKDDGSRNVYSTGAVRPCAQLVRAYGEGAFPLDCSVLVIPSKQNPGQSTYQIVSADHF